MSLVILGNCCQSGWTLDLYLAALGPSKRRQGTESSLERVLFPPLKMKMLVSDCTWNLACAKHVPAPDGNVKRWVAKEESHGPHESVDSPDVERAVG